MIIDKKEYQFLSNMYILYMKNVRRNEYFMYTYSINQRTILHWVHTLLLQVPIERLFKHS